MRPTAPIDWVWMAGWGVHTITHSRSLWTVLLRPRRHPNLPCATPGIHQLTKPIHPYTKQEGMFQRATAVAVAEAAPAAGLRGLRRQCLSTATGAGSSSVSSSSSSRLGGEAAAASRCMIRSRAEVAVGVVGRQQRRQLHAAGGVSVCLCVRVYAKGRLHWVAG